MAINNLNEQIEQTDSTQNTPFEALAKEREQAEQLKKQTIYAGVFVDDEELYNLAPPKLEKRVNNPHITTKFRPDAVNLLLNSLGSQVKITVVGYGNDGKNEGLLVKAESDDPMVQEALNKIDTPHITLSCSADGKPKDTANLEFLPIDSPFDIEGKYGLFLNGGNVITDKLEHE